MRPIDADAFYNNLVGYAPPEMVWDAGDIEHKLDEMPTLTLDDIVPHGRWIHDYCNVFACSNCLERECMAPYNLRNYCPSCGAKMDLEEENA